MVSIPKVKPAKVWEWLRSLEVAPTTKGHIKALMNQLFEKAMLWELIPVGRNPMQLVHVKGISKRTKRPVILGEDDCLALIETRPALLRSSVLKFGYRILRKAPDGGEPKLLAEGETVHVVCDDQLNKKPLPTHYAAALRTMMANG